MAASAKTDEMKPALSIMRFLTLPTWIAAVSPGLAVVLLSACVTSERQAPSFATGFDIPETDAILIEWRECIVSRPCIEGDWKGEDYRLGFVDSPAVLEGAYGRTSLRLELDPESVYRLGDHAIDMVFVDRASRAILSLTWNEREQRPLDSQLVVDERR